MRVPERKGNPVLKALLLAAIVLAGAAAQADELLTNAEVQLRSLGEAIADAAGSGDPASVRFRISASPIVEAAAVWDASGQLMYPDPDSLPHLIDAAALRALPAFDALRISADPATWEASDASGETLRYCLARPDHVCLLANRTALADMIGATPDALTAALFEPQTRPWRLAIPFVLALAALAAFPLARRGILRRSASHPTDDPDAFTIGDLNVSPRRLSGRRPGLEIDLTARDIRLLRCLADRPGDVLSKNALYDSGWGRDFMPNSRALDQHILTLRRKLDPDRSRPTLIETVHGHGYRAPTT